MKRLFIVLGLALTLGGCGGDSSTSTSTVTPTAPAAERTLSVLYSRPDGAVRYTAQDAQGQAVFGPVTFAPAPSHFLTGLPAQALTLKAEGVQGDFTTQVNLTSQSGIVSDPQFVASEAQDPTVSSFASYGCNRVQKADVKASIPSTANEAQLTQDFKELATLQPRPSHLFFTGDLVLNEVPGSQTLAQQLTAWKQFYASAGGPANLVAMTGNHEVLIKLDDGTEIPNPETLPVWTALMGAFIRGSNGPTTAAPNSDGLLYDQSQLSYSFIEGDTAYVVLNTDTFIDLTTEGDVPLHWLEAQLSTLNADPKVSHIFLFGHRPASYSGEGGIRPDEIQPFIALLNMPGSKVRAYLCAHVHLWASSYLGSVPQIIAGNGGSQAESSFAHGYYGYTLVKRKRSGRFYVESFGRPIPKPYDSTAAQPATTLREKFSISL